MKSIMNIIWNIICAVLVSLALLFTAGCPLEDIEALRTRAADLSAPGNVQVTARSARSISLAWDAAGRASGYHVYRSGREAGPYVKLNSSPLAGTSFTDEGLDVNAPYYYQISAVLGRVEGNRSAAVAGETVLGTPGNARVTAVSGTYTGGASAGSVSLAWDSVSGADGYNVYRSGSLEGVYAKVNSVPITETSYADTGLASKTSYYYKVSAIAGTAESAFSAVVSTVTMLGVPNNIRVSAATANSIVLAWNAVGGASGYWVYRAENEGGGYSKLSASPITGTSCADTDLPSNTKYYYRVSAISDGVESVPSPVVSAATLLDTPGNVRVNAVTANSVSLEWDAVSKASGYNVYLASSENGSYYKLNSSPITGTAYTSTGLSSNAVLYYKVSAVAGTAESLYSPAVSAVLLPAIPGNVRVTASSVNSVSLAWNAVSGASGYHVYRSGSEAGDYTTVNTSPVTGTSYTDTGLTINTQYYYRISAVKGALESVPSAALPADTFLGVPGDLRTSAITTNSVSLAWNAVSGASGYTVYRAASETGPYSQLSAAVINGTAFIDNGLAAYTSYYYRVSAAADAGVESAQSSAMCATTGVPVTAVSGLAPKLDWIRSSAISNTLYIIEVSANENIGPQTLSLSGKTGVIILLKGILTTRAPTLPTIPPITNPSPDIPGGNTAQGRIVSLASTGALFTVGSGVTLILDSNLTLKGRGDNNRAVAVIESGGSLVMNAGTIITGNTTTAGSSAYHGGGVRVNSGGIFTLNGGSISGNGGADNYGGGVYNRGTFVMRGGEISGNSGYTGGGVYNYAGTFSMSGGVIYGSGASSALKNTASSSGAALYNRSGSTAQYGAFSEGVFYGYDLSSSDGTIRVVDGSLQTN